MAEAGDAEGMYFLHYVLVMRIATAEEGFQWLEKSAGRGYRFGPLRVEGLQLYKPELVARYNRVVQPGRPYREERLNALQSTLQSTPYFASAQASTSGLKSVSCEPMWQSMPVMRKCGSVAA